MPPALYALVTFEIGPLIYAQVGPDTGSPTYTSLRDGTIGAYHHAQLLLVEMESLELFFILAWAGLDPLFSLFLPPK
jgi:hypothetical protein